MNENNVEGRFKYGWSSTVICDYGCTMYVLVSCRRTIGTSHNIRDFILRLV